MTKKGHSEIWLCFFYLGGY